DLVCHGRAAIACEAHDLVFALVHGKAEIGRERRIKHAQGVGKTDLSKEVDRGALRSALTETYGQGRPLADAVRGQKCGLAYGCGEKGCRRMRAVVLRKQYLGFRYAELG